MLKLFNDVFNNPALTAEEVQAARHALAKIAQETSVKGYVCEPTDGWKLWIGPTKAAVLCNETKDIAFACNRGYWQTFYHGASLCYVETVKEETYSGWQTTSVSVEDSLSESLSLHTKSCYPLLSWKSSTQQAGVGILDIYH